MASRIVLGFFIAIAAVRAEGVDAAPVYWGVSYPTIPYQDSLDGCQIHLSARDKHMEVGFWLSMRQDRRAGLEPKKPRFRVHHADGTADPWVDPFMSGEGGAGVESFSITGSTPYGANSFANGWIEAEILNETWWFEIPHGLLRDPAAPPCAPETETVPLIAVPAMTSMAPHHLVPWRAVGFGGRTLANGTRVTLHIAATRHAELVRVLLNRPWRDLRPPVPFTLREHPSAVDVAIPRYSLVTGTALACVLTRQAEQRQETFSCVAGSNGMDFALVTVAVADQHFDWSVPCGLLVDSDHDVRWPVPPEAGKDAEFVSDEPDVATEW